jgi:hypothetical protein
MGSIKTSHQALWRELNQIYVVRNTKNVYGYTTLIIPDIIRNTKKCVISELSWLCTMMIYFLTIGCWGLNWEYMPKFGNIGVNLKRSLPKGS